MVIGKGICPDKHMALTNCSSTSYPHEQKAATANTTVNTYDLVHCLITMGSESNLIAIDGPKLLYFSICNAVRSSNNIMKI